jgi:PAS domain-containing protein
MVRATGSGSPRGFPMRPARSGPDPDGQGRRLTALLARLFLRFVHVPAARLDAEIDLALQRICASQAIQRAALWQGPPGNPGRWRLSHSYQNPAPAPIDPSPEAEEPSGTWSLPEPEAAPAFPVMPVYDRLPWVMARLLARETVVLERPDDLPAAADRDRRSLCEGGVASVLAFPLEAAGEVCGTLVFATLGLERPWEPWLAEGLGLMAQAVASALVRMRSDAILDAGTAHLAMAAAFSKAGLWRVEPPSGRVWADRTARELLGLDRKGRITWDQVLAQVLPADRPGMERHLGSLRPGVESDLECRFLRPDGGLRWVRTRVRLGMDPGGEVDSLTAVTLDITEKRESEQQLLRRLDSSSGARGMEVPFEEQPQQPPFLGESDSARRVRLRLLQAAQSQAAVLITGETGTGKNLAAALVHAQGPCAGRPMVILDCALLPRQRTGPAPHGGADAPAPAPTLEDFLALAQGSTLFLDEVDLLGPEQQARLLGALPGAAPHRPGPAPTPGAGPRIIAGSSLDLARAVRQGQFREDLWLRLGAFPINLPPLREHKEDIPTLAQAVFARLAARLGGPVRSAGEGLLRQFQAYDWPGNVRELENVIERTLVLAPERPLELDALPGLLVPPPPPKERAGRNGGETG